MTTEEDFLTLSPESFVSIARDMEWLRTKSDAMWRKAMEPEVEKWDAILKKLMAVDTLDSSQTVRVEPHSLALLIAENTRLSAQVDELQTRGTEMAAERQRWRDPMRIAKIAAKLTTSAALGEDPEDIAVRAMRELVEAP